jgi:hypothetical protein
MDVLQTWSFFHLASFVDTSVKHAASRKTKQIRWPYHDYQNKKV